jgi:hypothetical protein
MLYDLNVGTQLWYTEQNAGAEDAVGRGIGPEEQLVAGAAKKLVGK